MKTLHLKQNLPFASNHTPGPWINDGTTSASKGWPIVNSKWGEICRVAYTGDSQSEANAALIASAPQLLADNAELREVLERLTDRAEQLISDLEAQTLKGSAVYVSRSLCHDTAKQARAVLARDAD